MPNDDLITKLRIYSIVVEKAQTLEEIRPMRLHFLLKEAACELALQDEFIAAYQEIHKNE
jgi:hypothetical protein